jgi:hypothetical protein
LASRSVRVLCGKTGEWEDLAHAERSFGNRIIPVCRVIFFISKMASELRISAVTSCPTMTLLCVRPSA